MNQKLSKYLLIFVVTFQFIGLVYVIFLGLYEYGLVFKKYSDAEYFMLTISEFFWKYSLIGSYITSFIIYLWLRRLGKKRFVILNSITLLLFLSSLFTNFKIEEFNQVSDIYSCRGMGFVEGIQ